MYPGDRVPKVANCCTRPWLLALKMECLSIGWELSGQKEDDKNVNLKSENFQRSKKKKNKDCPQELEGC